MQRFFFAHQPSVVCLVVFAYLIQAVSILRSRGARSKKALRNLKNSLPDSGHAIELICWLSRTNLVAAKPVDIDGWESTKLRTGDFQSLNPERWRRCGIDCHSIVCRVVVLEISTIIFYINRVQDYLEALTASFSNAGADCVVSPRFGTDIGNRKTRFC